MSHNISRYTSLLFVLFLALLPLLSRAHGDHSHDEEDEDAEDYSKITYGSAIKLKHKGSGYHLHSHSIKWGSGSGQQSVTGFEGSEDPNSLWQVKEGLRNGAQVPIAYGTVVKCGDIIRLQHASTKRFLHSHLHSSPLTHRQELSAYGDEQQVDGKVIMTSDTGDNWRLDCIGGKTEWLSDGSVSLVHVDTDKRLFTRRQDMFDQNNCRGCPIVNQLEVSAHSSSLSDGNSLWTVSQESGIFFPVSN